MSTRCLLSQPGSYDRLTVALCCEQTKTCISTTVAHMDFIKTVLVIPELDALVTGSSDKDLRIWDLSSLDSFDYSTLSSSASSTTTTTNSEQPEVKSGGGGAAPPSAISNNPLPLFSSLKSHTRPIERLAYFPITTSTPPKEGDGESEKTGKIGLVSTDSMGVLKIWELEKVNGTNGRATVKGIERSSVRHHELAIYDLLVGSEAGEIWTGNKSNPFENRLSLPP